MIPTWPPKPRHNTKKLREAINARAQTNALADFMASVYVSTREAAERLQAMRDAIEKAIADIDSLRSDKTADITNRHLTNIRDDLTAAIDESARP
nr:MAG TPA: Roseltide rT7, PLANT PROTEIN [Caudoviricetes sp.]